MKILTRRQFLKLCTTATIAVSASGSLFSVAAEALQRSNQSIIWVQGAGCSGCSSSMLNTVDPGVRQVLKEIVNLKYHPGLTDLQGFRFIDQQLEYARANRNNFILVVEGAMPQNENGQYFIIGYDASGSPVTLTKYLEELGRLSKSVVALGSCASFGGLPSADPNVTGTVGLDKVLRQNKVVNIPGCPPHPDWVVGTLAHMALYGMPELDDFGRPKVFFEPLIHNNCPRRQFFDNSVFATKFGETGCLLELGCKGPLCHGDCSTRLWNNGTSWCVQAGAPCIGCTEPSFPNLTLPFYTRMPKVDLPGINATADTIGATVGIATGVGLAAHFVGHVLSGRLSHRIKEEGDHDA